MEKPLLDCIFSLLFLLPFVLYVCTVSVPFLVVLSMLSVGTCIKLTFYLLGFSVTGFSLSLSPPLWDQLPFPSQILCCQLLLCLPRLHASGVLLPPPPGSWAALECSWSRGRSLIPFIVLSCVSITGDKLARE